jgi:hypothetical protein
MHKSQVYFLNTIYKNPKSKSRTRTARRRCQRTSRRSCARRGSRAGRRRSCPRYRRLHNLAQGIKDNIDQSIERRIRVLFLNLAARQLRLDACVRHVLQVVTYDAIDCLTCCTNDGLDDVSEVIDNEVEGGAALGDRAEETVYGAYYGVDLIRWMSFHSQNYDTER